MYRLVLYALIGLIIVAMILGGLGYVPYSSIDILATTIFLLIVSIAANTLFAYAENVPTNVESAYISALILALILTPARSASDFSLLFWTAIWCMASKYIFSIGKKHIFNPVAVAIILMTFTVHYSASWWVGTSSMVPFVTIVGFLIIRKIRRFNILAAFTISSCISLIITNAVYGFNPIQNIWNTALYTPWIFFATVMLTEPLTMPPTNILKSLYAVLIGILINPRIHFGPLFMTPESALLIGNIFSFIVSPKNRVLLAFKEKIQLAPDIFEFDFVPNKQLLFTPGQYMEWTLGHDNPDIRGNRRYFTISSSPTEPLLKFAITIQQAKGSSFKRSLLAFTTNHTILVSQLAGDFTLPINPSTKLVFMAGGIGVTPFRSMIRYIIDTNQTRDIIVLYASSRASDFVYADDFTAASSHGVKTIYTITNPYAVPSYWTGRTGRINETMLREEVPDFLERYFYLSGPEAMVDTYKQLLRSMHVPERHIITDYFPGF
jgi:glycine betaine catabolism B